jgi:hypothetical protein
VKPWFGVAAVVVLALWAYGPIGQDPAYHLFADTRPVLGVPNGLDVLSNLAFAAAGIFGLAATVRRNRVPQPSARRAYIVFFVGALLTSVGSAYYHLAPGDARLVWDRIPMTIAFGGLVAAVIAERVSPRSAARALAPLVALGVGSVWYWEITGDLRPYAVAQFGSLLAVVAVLVTRPGRRPDGRFLAAGLAVYALAKVLEGFDGEILALSGAVGGHTLKHLAAAAGIGFVGAEVATRDDGGA